MKAKKRMLAILLALIVALTFSGQVLAVDTTAPVPSTVSESEQISPRVICTNCWIGFLVETCYGEMNWYNSSTHTSGGKRCIVNYFTSGGCYVCETCLARTPFEYPEFGNQHLCIENHSSCGKGHRSVCPLGGIVMPGN